MIRVRPLAIAAAAGLTLATLGALAPAAQATTPATPGSITAVSAKPGPGPGEVTFTWAAAGTNTTAYYIETALTSFKVGDARLPDHGRGSVHFTITGGTRRSVTLAAASTAAAGASVASANHLYYRFSALNKTSYGTAVRSWPYQQSVAVAPAVPKTTGTALRVASFNVRTARATDSHPWLTRLPLVAAAIIAKNPGVAAIQELNPGRADGLAGATNGTPRQTESLVTELHRQGATKYKLVRTTPYIAPTVTEGTQGARILYDSTRYRQLSACYETTSGAAYSSSCSILLPIRSTDGITDKRRAAYAVFEDLTTGARFVMVSAHLDPRHSSDAATEQSLEALRGNQMVAILLRVKAVNSYNLPVVMAGDLNSWQNNQNGYRAHDTLIANGYYDTAAAKTQVNTAWTTINDYLETIPLHPSGWGARLDAIAVKGIVGAAYFENVMKVTDPNRPSDHNLVIADVRVP